MPREHETIRNVGPVAWPEDPDERIRRAREVTIAAKAPYVAAQKRREIEEAAKEEAMYAKMMTSPLQQKPRGVEGAQTK